MWKVVMFSALWPSLAFSEPFDSKLMTHIPRSLSREGGYDHTTARFGDPPYGGSIAQNVYYFDAPLCSSFDVRWGQVYPTPKDGSYPEPPFIMMVDRDGHGDCNYVRKVRNAQKNGATAVLIANTRCLCGEEECTSHHACDYSRPTMFDDGSGGDISIPSFLVFKQDADLIKKELLLNNTFQAEMSWRVPSQGQRVEYDLWSELTDPLSLNVLSSFKEVATSLGESAHFTPLFVLDPSRNYADDTMVDVQCTNHGRYCIEAANRGTDMVTEILRRLCIWNEYGAHDGIGSKWWEYVTLFNDRCLHKYDIVSDCHEDIMERVGIDPENVRRCIRSSGGLEADAPNAILEKELELQSKIFRIPTFTVNGFGVEGALTIHNAFDAICGAFSPGDEPEICQKCFGCKDVPGCVSNNGMCRNGFLVGNTEACKGKVSTVTFVLSLLFVTAVYGAVGLSYYKRSQTEMHNRVRAIMADYLPLENEDEQKDG